MGRVLILLGLALVGLGVVLVIAERANLPGDVVFRGKHTSVYFPVVTCVLLSLLGSVLLWLFNRR